MTLHTHTPVLCVLEPRGLPVRSVAFYCAQADEDVAERVDRSAYDVAARRVDRWDPRLWAAANMPGAPSNVNLIHSLSGQELFSDSVDAGWRAQLLAEDGVSQFRWDAKRQIRRVEYDQSRRPTAVFEGDEIHQTCVERLAYGGPGDALNNQCGQLVRHDDQAGSLLNTQFGLTEKVVQQSRWFLKEMSAPDWPEAEVERDVLLEPGDGAVSRWRFGALGEKVEQTDAFGNVQLFTQAVSGQQKSTRLRLDNQAIQTLISDIRYDAHGRVEVEIAENGIITRLDYDAADGSLCRLNTDNGLLQDLHYRYDSVGNVVSIEDRAQPIRHFANQQIEPLRTFAYDTLYQLIEATGFEAATNNRGPASFQSFATANELSNYTQRYEYDAAGNLQVLAHVGAQRYTRVFVSSRSSNRSLLQTADQPPTQEQIAASFDPNGNLRELQPGQPLRWDWRNQLAEVTPVERDSGANDSEAYSYDAQGMRVRKVRISQAKSTTHIGEVRYLPGLEIRRNSATGEELHVVSVTAGRSDVRLLHWQSVPPEHVANDQARYSLTDHLGSSTLELDGDRELISQEVYYPYGQTAWFAGRDEVEANYRTVRYSGKERDASGLYCYGLRYYAPWLMRWINPDPAGFVDGLNLYRFVRNNPVTLSDFMGMDSQDSFGNEIERIRLKAISAMKKAIKIIESDSRDAVASVDKVMERFFGTSDLETKKKWVADIKKILEVAEAMGPGNYDLAPDDSRGYVAEVDMTNFTDFRYYLKAQKEVAGGDLSRLEKWTALRRTRKEYQDAKETPFLKIKQEKWAETRKEAGESHVVQVLIHEFSHAALDTRDFAYGRAKKGSDPSPLFELPTDQPEVSTPGGDFRQSAGMSPTERAYRNADSFAAAVMFVKHGATRKKPERSLYRRYIESH